MAALVCPQCRGALAATRDALGCAACARDYPIVAGIPDLRLEPDPYIDLDADREKALHLADAARTRSFEALVRYYYEITPEDPADLAARWTRRAVDEVRVGHAIIAAFGPDAPPVGGTMLDVGCGTAGLTIAWAQTGWHAIGADIALRWLVVAQRRVRDVGVPVTLVCASARHLPFADGTFPFVCANDAIEHMDGAPDVMREVARVSARGARVVFTGNNRYAPLPEPQMRLWGVGCLPRAWQRRYVSARRRDTHPYRIVLRSAREMAALFGQAGFVDVTTRPGALVAAHLEGRALDRITRVYNGLRRQPIIRPVLRAIGPRWEAWARRA